MTKEKRKRVRERERETRYRSFLTARLRRARREAWRASKLGERSIKMRG
jgi:hypothetical protein